MPLKKLIRITTVPISLNKLLEGQLRFMKEYYDVLAISAGPKEELEEVRKREGVRTVQVAMTRFITPVKDVKALWQLYRLFKKEKPHIVHTHTPKAGIVGMMAARMARVPHRLHTVAGLPLLEAIGGKRRLLDTVEKLTYACATKVYPNSRGLYDIILKNSYCHEAKLKVIGNGSSNGIDTAHFSSAAVSGDEKVALREELGISESDFVFVFVGRLVGDKGINELITAFTQLSQSQPPVTTSLSPLTIHPSPLTPHKLLLVGPFEPTLDPLLPETLKEIRQNLNILSVGYQSNVRPYLAISNALAFPSYREGFPNVVMQAGALGLPSIVTDINGCNEIIEEGVNGLIIPVKDAAALQKSMQKLLTDSKLYDELQTQARPMINSRYEQQVVWEALLKEYRSLGG